MSEFWIQTFTGKKFDLLESDESMIDIIDIAHHLSIENRFNGATKFPYSVAYHSILVSSKCSTTNKLEGLLHDAHEAYTKDLPTPLKRFLNIKFRNSFIYENLSNKIQNLIKTKFSCIYSENSPIDINVKFVDLRMAKTEREQLLVEPPEPWHYSIENAEPYNDINILNLSAENVEDLFLKEYEKYRRD